MNLQEQLAFLKRYGLINWAFASGYKVLHRSLRYRAYRCMTLSADDVDSRFMETPEGLVVRHLSASEFSALPNGTKFLSDAALRERAQRDDWASTILDGEKIAAYGWYTSAPCVLNEVHDFHFDRRYVYMYDGFTDPGYRGRQLHAYGMAHAVRRVTDEGFLGLVSNVEASNFASLRSVERLGYEVFGTCRSVRLFGRDIAWGSKACRAHHISLEPRAGVPT